ncbi:MAG: hypothetical protein NC180_11235 [Muribaculaceae bacterium]|nr:chorion class high-cysteine HCB protein 13 [Roseburia sp.]MCM1430984.1 hypothetical protein [Muribaculaceae bacterium]MCM1493782.1 hypothetical protein [Muribaculaceae bacterium]
MSDLAATNCGCNTSDNGCCNIIWIILLLSCFCGNGGSVFGGNGCGGNDSCWIIILLLLCGCNGNGGIF